MAAGDITPARRVPVPESGNVNDVWPDMQPGDYCGPVEGFSGDKPAVFFIPPGLPGIRHVVSPPHVFTEQPDGSLEIRESLGCEPQFGGGYGWHGYLDAGHIWREV